MVDTMTLPDRFALHGLGAVDQPGKLPSQAIVLKLGGSLLQDVRKAAATPTGVQFVTGTTPRLRLGKRIIDLTISAEAFEHELYAASRDALSDLHLTSIVSHRAQVKAPLRKQSLGPDAALAALKNSLDSYEQEKQAKSTNITSTVLPVPQSRFDAARAEKKARRRGLLNNAAESSPNVSGALRAAAIPKSAAANEGAARQRAMRTPIIHLLAIKPLTSDEIQEKTHIPRDELVDMLGRVGREDQGKWQLVDRTYKDLDVWEFGYPSQSDRQQAIDNSIRAYDRLRIDKEDKLWQQLLMKEERGKGIFLSKLHFSGNTVNKALTPNREDVSALDGAGDSGRDQSATNTPRLGATKNDAASGLSKTLFAKDPKKARAAEEKKRKVKETAGAASDKDAPRPKKKQVTKTNNPKVKSAALVEDSSDENGEEGEVKEAATARGALNKPSAAPLVPPKAATNAAASKTTAPSSRAPDATGNGSAGKLQKPRTSLTSASKALGATPKTNSPAAAASVSKPSKPASSGTLAPASARARNHPSPPKTDSKPLVPSPLGAARPRVMSDVSNRDAVGVQRVHNGTEKTVKPAVNAKNVVRKRHDTVTGSIATQAAPASEPPSAERKPAGPSLARKTLPGAGTTATPARADAPTAKPTSQPNSASTLKRKPANAPPNDTPPTKTRRVEAPDRVLSAPSRKSINTSSTPSSKPSTSTTTKPPVKPSPANPSSTAAARQRNPAPAHSSGSASSSSLASQHHHGSRSARSNSSSSSSIPLILDANPTAAAAQTASSSSSTRAVRTLSFPQGVHLARKFRDELYPRYVQLYDSQAAAEARGEKVPAAARARLWEMHEKLEMMKLEIRGASLRGE